MHRNWVAVFMLLAASVVSSCSVDPETAKREFLADGNRYMAEKKYPAAIVQYRNALRQDDKFAEARLKLTDAYLAIGDVRNALREAVRAADLLPDDIEAQLRAGTLLLVSRQFPEARARATAVLAKDPKNPRALMQLGNAFAGLKDLDTAVELIEQAIDADPQLTLTYTNLGALQVAKGDQEAAEAALRRAVDVAPRSALAHATLGNFLWAAGRYDEAERELKAALDIEPKSPSVNRALAGFHLARNRMPEAEAYLKTYADVNGTTESKILLADYYVRMGKAPDAIGLLTAVAKQPEGFVRATTRLSALDFANGRRPEAYSKLDQVLAREPTNELAIHGKARYLLLEGKGQEALAAATSLVNANPKSLRGQYVRGLALEATGSPDRAIEAYQEVLRIAPAAVPAQAKLASLHLARRNFKDALSLAQQVVKAQPRSSSAHLLYAQALFRTGDLANAERELLALAKATPSSADVHTWLGMLYDAKRDVRSARRSFERALELKPDSDVALAGLVDADMTEKRPAAALARIEAQLAKTPDDTKLVMMSAMAYSAARDIPKAEAAFRRLLEIDANAIEAYGGLGAIYLSQNRLDEARKSFEELARRQEKPVAAETMLGTILVRQNRPGEARKHFERALQLDPRAAVAANNLAWDYANTGGNLDVALQLAQTAKAEIPDNASVSDTLGFIYYKKGLSAIAVTTLREAIKQNPSNPNIHYHLGLAYLQNGNKAEARSTLQQVLKMSPKFPAADEVRRTLATIQG